MAKNPDKNQLDKDSNDTNVCSVSHTLMLKFTLLAQHTNQNRFNSLLITLTLQCFSIPSITNRINNKGMELGFQCCLCCIHYSKDIGNSEAFVGFDRAWQ